MQCGIDILLFLGRSISITPQSPDNPTFSGILDTYTGATAGYSTRRLTNTYTGGLIRVRRSSDDTEQDIGYDANGEDLDTFGLLAFVNEEITDDINTTTDSDSDGLADGLTSFGNGTYSIVTGNGHSGSAQRVDYNTGGSTLQAIRKTSLAPMIGQEITISFMYRSNITWSWTNGSSSATNFPAFSVNTGNAVRVTRKAIWNPTSGSGEVLITSWLENSGEFIEISDWSVTYHSADGHITTWYDQTGNGNNATNSTASEQPLIVEGGNIIYEGATISRPAIEFDGVDDYFTLGGTNDAGMLGDISVFSVNKNLGSSASVVVSTGLTGSSSASLMQWALTGDTSNQYLGTTSNGTTRINERVTAANYGSQVLVSMINDESGNLQLFADGVGSTGQTAVAPMNDANYPLEIGRDPFRSSYYFSGTQQELILYPSLPNRTGIQGNIDNYFRITS